MKLKQITGYEYYFISDNGKIFSNYTGDLKLMSPYKSKSCRYLMIKLSKGGTTKMHLIHRLVAEAFIPNPLDLPEVNHKDKNTTNNKVENLNWCTHKIYTKATKHYHQNVTFAPVNCFIKSISFQISTVSLRHVDIHRENITQVISLCVNTCV